MYQTNLFPSLSLFYPPRPPPPLFSHTCPTSHDALGGQPALVLIHGFGASVYHWRYNIPALVAKGYRVLALDLLGFGLSDKPIIEYSAETWRDQVQQKFVHLFRLFFFSVAFFVQVCRFFY